MKRRILLTTTAYPPSTGGVQAHVAELAARLANFEADVLTLWLKNRTDWLLGTTLRLPGNVAQPSPGVTTLGWSSSTRARMLPWVISYYAYPAVAARRIAAQMAPYVKRALRPEHALIHNHRIGREFLAGASLAVARMRGIPFVLTPHHHPKWRGYRYGGWLEVYREADAVLALTQSESAELQRLGVRAERVHVIGGAADPPWPADARRFRVLLGGSTEPLILFLGQQFEYKGIAELFEATAAIRSKGVKAQLAFAGPSTPFSTRFFSEHRESWLHVLGAVDEQTKWDAIEAASVVALPSRHEAFGRVYLEAWSKAKPVIGARIPAVSEVITEGETGFLVDPGSPDQLAGALERLITDPALAARLGANGSREVEGRFSWAAVIGSVEAVYEAVLARPRATGRAES